MADNDRLSTYQIVETTCDGLHYWELPELRREKGIIAVFTSRKGGCSRKPFESLNLSYKVGDNPQHVARNRELLAKVCGFRVEKYTFCRQVHDTKIHTVGVDDVGSGSGDWDSAFVGCDGLITRATSAVLGVLVADCLPIILVEPKTRGVGVIHAGWRGTLMGIAARGVRSLCKLLGVGAEKVVAVMGPSLCADCLELARESVEILSGRDCLGEKNDLMSEEKIHLDLFKINLRLLLDEGLRQENIFHLDICTMCNQEMLYSYRKEGGVTGRQAAFVSIRE